MKYFVHNFRRVIKALKSLYGSVDPICEELLFLTHLRFYYREFQTHPRVDKNRQSNIMNLLVYITQPQQPFVPG